MTPEQIRLATAHLKTAVLLLDMAIETTDEDEREDYSRRARKLARETPRRARGP